MSEKISAFIITKNEEKHIAQAILSIKEIVEEIIIVDSGSTDDTINIAMNLGAKVFYNDWPGYSHQKAYAESLCKNRWVLNLDADEELSVPLKNEIAYIFAAGVQDQYKGYSINFIIMQRSDIKPRWLAPNNRLIRLYKTEFASFKHNTKFSTRDAVSFNDGVSVENAVHNLYNPAYHYSRISIEQLTLKAMFYSSEQAKDMIADGTIPSKIRVCVEFFSCFLKTFFIRRYFIFGYKGFVDSIIFAFKGFLCMRKTRELIDEKKVQ